MYEGLDRHLQVSNRVKEGVPYFNSVQSLIQLTYVLSTRCLVYFRRSQGPNTSSRSLPSSLVSTQVQVTGPQLTHPHHSQSSLRFQYPLLRQSTSTVSVPSSYLAYLFHMVGCLVLRVRPVYSMVVPPGREGDCRFAIPSLWTRVRL